MFLLLSKVVVLSGLIAGIAAAPAPEPTPGPILNARLNARGPEFTGVSIPPVSIHPVSIHPVSIPSVSISIKPFTESSLSLDLPTPTCTQTLTRDKNGYLPPGTCNALYNFYPSFSAAVIMGVVFGILSAVHIAQAAISKKRFCWVVIMGALWETVGYLIRAAGSRDQGNSGLALISQLLVLLGPLWVNAFDYMLLARMIYYFIPSKSLIGLKPGLLSVIFVSLDIVSFVIQLIGGGMAGPGQSQAAIMKGIHIYMGGIGLQEFFIVFFFGLAVKFHLEMLKIERTGALNGTPKAKWRRLVFALYTSLIFITVRIIFRLVEFSSGDSMSNPLPYHEAYSYVFDALPMFFAILTWNISHPGKILKGPDSVMPSGQLRAFCCFCCRGRNKKTKDAGKAGEINHSDSEYLDRV